MTRGSMKVKSTEYSWGQFLIYGNLVSGRAPKPLDRVRVLRTGKIGSVSIVSSKSTIAKEIDGIDLPLSLGEIVAIGVDGLDEGDVTANDMLEICD